MSTLGGNATFRCLSTFPVIDRVQWLVNGSLFDLGPDVTAKFSSDVQTGILNFTNLPLEYNMIMIQCKVTLPDERIFISNVTLLLIQG